MRRTILPFFLTLIATVVATVGCAGGSSLAETGPVSSTATLVSADEPGTPLLITGTVYAADGRTPVEGVELYVYQTDDRGYYGEQMMDNQAPRLNAAVRTGADGRYELRTIKPGPYPNGGVPAHVHFVASGTGYPEQRFELHFEGDPALDQYDLDRSRALGAFGSIRKLEPTEEGGLSCVHDLRMRN